MAQLMNHSEAVAYLMEKGWNRQEADRMAMEASRRRIAAQRAGAAK